MCVLVQIWWKVKERTHLVRLKTRVPFESQATVLGVFIQNKGPRK